jgi:hypothetical protein
MIDKHQRQQSLGNGCGPNADARVMSTEGLNHDRLPSFVYRTALGSDT